VFYVVRKGGIGFEAHKSVLSLTINNPLKNRWRTQHKNP